MNKYRNLEIKSYNKNDWEGFRKIFENYFLVDFRFNISKETLDEICYKIIKQTNQKITYLDMLFFDEKIVGFINYQIDTKESDWCEKEGWGLIREIAINKNIRRNGLGKKLVLSTEKKLKNLGVKNIYLTSDEAKDFWINCGYIDSGECSTINEDNIYIKSF